MIKFPKRDKFAISQRTGENLTDTEKEVMIFPISQ